MDFLDPRKRRSHKIRLFIGYFLVGIVILLSTVILVYGANGYGINTKTGQIIQNGLLFVDSKPGGADIYLNGKKQSATTAARLVLPAAKYDLSIQKDGYKGWQRSFVLDEHTVARYVYPFLFPVKPITFNLKSYSSSPGVVTETPDRHWLLVQTQASGSGGLAFDQYDTSNLAKAPDTIELPVGILTPADESTFKEVEWSTNNNQLLILHSYPGGNEFIVFNRSKPDQSYNVNKLFKAEPSEVALKNKRTDELYLFNKSSGTLQLADTGQGTLASPFLKHVLEFKPYGNDIVTYVSDFNTPKGKVAARIWDNTKTYPLYTFNPSQKYLVDAAQFHGHMYFVVGGDSEAIIKVFKDPEDNIRDPRYGKAIPLIALNDLGASKVSFSDNARFIAAQASNNFAVYDLEQADLYRYTTAATFADNLSWMDGHRFIGQSGDQIYISDYDNKNIEVVGKTILPNGAYFSRDYNQMITIVPTPSGVTVERIDLRAGADLPADHSQ